MVELVDELERLANGLWCGGKSESAASIGASDIYDVIGKLGVAIDRARREAEVRHKAALEAFWADKARLFAVSAPKGENAVRSVDQNMAISVAAVRLDAQRGEFLRLLDLFAMEFVALALDFYKPTFEVGEICFKCRDFAAAEKRARALKRLAAGIDELKDGYDVGKTHELIITYSNERRGDTKEGREG